MGHPKEEHFKKVIGGFELARGVYSIGSSESCNIKIKNGIASNQIILKLNVRKNLTVEVLSLSLSYPLEVDGKVLQERDVSDVHDGQTVIILGTPYELSFLKSENEGHLAFSLSQGDEPYKSRLELVEGGDLFSNEETPSRGQVDIDEVRLDESIKRKKSMLQRLENEIGRKVAAKGELSGQIIELKDYQESELAKLETHKSSIDKINFEINNLVNSKEELKFTNKNLLIKIEDRKIKNKRLDSEYSKLSKNIIKLEQQCALLVEDKKENSSELSKIREQVEEKRKTLAQIGANAQEKRAELEKLEKHFNVTNRNITKANQLLMEKDRGIRDLNNLTSRAKSDYQVLCEKVREKSGVSSHLQEEIEILKNDLSATKQEYLAVKDKYASQDQRLHDDYIFKKNNLSKKIVNYEEQQQNLSISVHALEEDIAAFTIEQECLSKSIDTLQIKKDEVESDIDKSQFEKTDLAKEVHLLKEDLDKLESEKRSLEQVILLIEEEKQDSARSLESKKFTLQSELEELKRSFEHEQESDKKTFELELKNKSLEHEQHLKALEAKSKEELDEQRRVETEKNRKIESDTLKSKEEILVNAKIEAERILRSSELKANERESRVAKTLQDKERQILAINEKLNGKIDRANDLVEEKRAEASSLIERAHSLYSCKREESNEVLRIAEAQAQELLKSGRDEYEFMIEKARKEVHGITDELRQKRQEFERELAQEKKELKNYFQFRKDRHKKHLDQMNDEQKIKLEKDYIFFQDEMRKEKRKFYKKLVRLKIKVRSDLDREVEYHNSIKREMNTEHLGKVFAKKKEVQEEIDELKKKSRGLVEETKKSHDKVIKELNDREMLKLGAMRRELEKEFQRKADDQVREKERERKQRIATAAQSAYSLFLEHGKDSDSTAFISLLREDIGLCLEGQVESAQRNPDLNVDIEQRRGLRDHIRDKGWKVALGAICASVLVFNVLGSRTWVFDTFNSVVADHVESAKEVQNEELRKIKEIRTFNPALTSDYKDSYTRNVLYTSGYISRYESEAFQNSWILAFHAYITNELELSEEFAVNFVSSEGTLVKELAQLRGKIDPKFLDITLKEMNKKEEVFVNWARTQVSDEAKWAQVKGFTQKYFEEFTGNE